MRIMNCTGPRRILFAFYLLLGATPLFAAEPATGLPVETPKQRDARMDWWREARFGMFVHWGLYSGLAGTWDGKPVATRGGMEWIQQRVGADTDTYAQRAVPLFQPKKGFAREWAKLAKAAGCRYVVFTTKHHDGFALHNSFATTFDAGTVLQRDLVLEIVEALRAEGLRVGFYYSVVDWHHDQYAYNRSTQLPHPFRGQPYPNGDRDHNAYIKYLHTQVNELISNYGPIDILWWDYSSLDFQGDEAWRAFELMRLVRAKQPTVIMNNRLFRTREAGWGSMGVDGYIPQLDNRFGDFITPEQRIPTNGLPAGLDWETCMTLNTTWGYSAHDHAWKSDEAVIRNLVDIASKGGNYLLNIGPKGDGTIPDETLKTFRAIGAWMKVNRDAIYGTTANPFKQPLPWGRCTKKVTKDGTTLYLHVFDWPIDGKLLVPGLKSQIDRVSILRPGIGFGKKMPVAADAGGVTITLPVEPPDKISSTVVVKIKGPLEIE